jgi:hypothetical protein
MTTDVIVITGTRLTPPYDPGPSGPGMHLHPDTDQGGGGGDWGDPDPVQGEDPCQGQSEASSAHLPDDIQGVRSVAQTAAATLIGLVSGTQFLEHGVFVVRNQHGTLRATQPFTSNSIDTISFRTENGVPSQPLQVLRSIPSTDTIVGFVHLHQNDPRPSENDAQFAGHLRYNSFWMGSLAMIDANFMDYIVWTPPSHHNVPGTPSIREFSEYEMAQIRGGNTNACGLRLD